MEHERGAFKVNLSKRSTQLRNDQKFTRSHARISPSAAFGARNIVPEF
jgi:hypothetical protein